MTPKKNRLSSRQNGFSLLELLVAFSITTMVLITVYQLHIKGNKIALLGQDYAQAVVIAESMLAEFDGSQSSQRDSGQVNRFQWQRQAKAYLPEQDSLLPLVHVEVSVTWLTAGQPRTIQLRALKPRT